MKIAFLFFFDLKNLFFIFFFFLKVYTFIKIIIMLKKKIFWAEKA
jgi:hypothetical protein